MGRVESRLGAAALPFLLAVVLSGALETWWPLELVGIMVGVGLVLDPLYHRLLDYQPGWAALPLGAVELGVTMAIVLSLAIRAPLWPALALFAFAWVVAQALGHAVFPFLHLTYGEDGGELGRGAVPLAVLAPAALLAALGTAWSMEPPTRHLAAGVHLGPIVLDEPVKLVGEHGTVVRGGIVVRADDVEIRHLSVVGGEHGIAVEGADDVVVDNVTITGSSADGVHARDASLVVSDCRIHLSGEWTQAIDISFGIDADPSRVERCTVAGGREGIVSHFATVDMVDNVVTGTTLRAITMTEMSMGHIERNDVVGALGTAIFCGDMSHCHIRDNHVAGTRRDPSSAERARQGYDILVHYYAWADLEDNDAAKVGTLVGGHIEH
jgi:Right handed beta helix region